MNICAIGDSHLAAVISAWKRSGGEHADVRFTFFGAPGDTMRGLRASNGSLVPGTSELRKILLRTTSKTEISADYDCFLVCALKVGIINMRKLLKLRGEAQARDDRAPLSDACFVRSVQGTLSRSLAVETIGKLRRISSAPILLMPQPLPVEGAERPRWIARTETNREDRAVANYFWEACRRVGDDLGLHMIWQPELTKAAPLRTKSIFSHGSTKLGRDVVHPENEPFHMNADYGDVMIRTILESVGSLRPGATAGFAAAAA